MSEIIRYRGFDIEHNEKGYQTWCVWNECDDFWFDTFREAKEFIDEIELREEN